MPFKAGNLGRLKGTKNNPAIMEVKKLLENAFVRNQSAAIAKIDAMFQSKDNTDFKFLLSLKATLEPKKIEHAGDGLKNTVIVHFGASNGVSREQLIRAEQ